MRASWMGAVSFTLGLLVGSGSAQEVPWRPAAPRNDPPDTRVAAPPPPHGIRLGPPVAADSSRPTSPHVLRAVSSSGSDHFVRPFTLLKETSASSSPAPPRFVRAQIGEAPAADVPPPPPPPPPPPDWFAPSATGSPPSSAPATRHKSKYGGGPEYPIFDAGRGWVDDAANTVGDWFKPGEGRRLFQSDHAFDHMISPVSNPFLFEDPRALTEIRPLLILQDTPSSNPVFRGGDVNFFGVQARVALTDRLSIVLSKFGWIWIDPEAPSGEFTESSGFAELHIGPKYTLIRNTNTCTLLALGLNFDIPTGPARVFQNTGDLSLTRYVSFGQNFGKTSWGSFNFLNTTGYSFRTDGERSEAFFSSFHLDFDVGNFHKIYPLIEVNWYHYARNGTVRDLSFEGKDLFNFGTRGIAGFDELSFAVGLRYKFTEMFQLGAAFEFPLLGESERRLDDFRFTFDVIFRF